MSNALAISAVTMTLRNLLIRGMADLPHQNVSTKPLDKARTADSSLDQVNIFLYQTALNAAWRNQAMPQKTRSGESGEPPLALNLHYLITAYGQGDDETRSHNWLGKAMSVFHDHPVLGASELKAALPESNLHAQIERIRITSQPLSLDEMSKLWTTFQSQYRISAAYQVEVVLIDSNRPTATPLPVLTRGPDDRGIGAQSDLISRYPTLSDVLLPGAQPAALLGDDFTVRGHHLDGTALAVEIKHPRLPAPLPLPPPAVGDATATAIKLNLPVQPDVFPVGIYTLAVLVQRPGEAFPRRTNELPLAIAPSMVLPIDAVRSGDTITFTLACSPNVLPDQQVALLVGGDEILAEPRTDPTANLSFVAQGVPPEKLTPGDYFVRLRVDGVDSLLIDRTLQPPKFKASQMVSIP